MHTEAVTAKCSMARRPKKCLRKSYIGRDGRAAKRCVCWLDHACKDMHGRRGAGTHFPQRQPGLSDR